jgi:hypothetical protein
MTLLELVSQFDIKSVLSGSAVSGSVGWLFTRWFERRKARRETARKACARLREVVSAWYSAIAEAIKEENTAIETKNALATLWRTQYFEPTIQNCIEDMAPVPLCRKLVVLAHKYKTQSFMAKKTAARSLVDVVLERHDRQFEKERAENELRGIYKDLDDEISYVRRKLG